MRRCQEGWEGATHKGVGGYTQLLPAGTTPARAPPQGAAPQPFRQTPQVLLALTQCRDGGVRGPPSAPGVPMRLLCGSRCGCSVRTVAPSGSLTPPALAPLQGSASP